MTQLVCDSCKCYIARRDSSKLTVDWRIHEQERTQSIDLCPVCFAGYNDQFVQMGFKLDLES